MTLAPDIPERIARARADLRMGVPVVLQAGDDRLLALAVETLSAERLAALRELSPVLVITQRRAETLRARVYDGDLARIELPATADLSWIQAVANPADDLRHPMKGPLHASRGGDVSAHRAAIALVKAARLLPSVLIARAPDVAGLTTLDLAEAEPFLSARSALSKVVAARVPLALARDSRLVVFRPEDGGEEHYAIVVGRPDRTQPVLARLHSACFTGDLLGSLKCDCGPQLRAALAQMGDEGAGVLLYLNQEGRGIGLANKMRAYALQDEGFDTVEANHRLGFEDDERDFRLGSDLLTELGFKSVRLMTNNPAKIAMMEATGIAVTARVPLKVGETDENRSYLATKAAKSGHML
jgi:GTP cyclohydrolase II